MFRSTRARLLGGWQAQGGRCGGAHGRDRREIAHGAGDHGKASQLPEGREATSFMRAPMEGMLSELPRMRQMPVEEILAYPADRD